MGERERENRGKEKGEGRLRRVCEEQIAVHIKLDISQATNSHFTIQLSEEIKKKEKTAADTWLRRSQVTNNA